MTGLFIQPDGRAFSKGLSPIDLLDIPEPLSPVLNQVIRRNGMKLEDIAAELGEPIANTRKMLDELTKKGYVQREVLNSEIWYKAQFGRKADKVLSQSIWAALDGVVEDEEREGPK